MSDESTSANDTTATVENASGATSLNTAQEPTGSSEGFQNPNVQSETVDSLPDFAQKIIKDLRKENAERRTGQEKAVNEAVASSEQKWTEQYNQLAQSYENALKAQNNAEMEYTKLQITLDAGVEPEKAKAFAARLQGATEEELRADAAELQKVFAAPEAPRRGDPSQGRASEPQGSPLAQWIQSHH